MYFVVVKQMMLDLDDQVNGYSNLDLSVYGLREDMYLGWWSEVFV